MELSSPITNLKGVGSEIAAKLSLQGIHTIDDLINNFPRRYDDYSSVLKIGQLSPGRVTIQVIINNVTGRYVRRGLHITEAIANDETGSVRLIWFNQPYRSAAIKTAHQYFVAGDYGLRRGRFTILNPNVELVSDFPVNTARIIPIYRETKGLKSAHIRRLIREALQHFDSLPEHLPTWLVVNAKLGGYHQSVAEMHFPSSAKALNDAKRRLGFEEVFQLSLAALLNKYELLNDTALAIEFKQDLAQAFVRELPFKLTDTQRKIVWRIYQDMSSTQPMNRLVEGDVGSGKTVIATMAALMAMNQDFQVALMAPTEIVALQHAETIQKLLSSVGYADQVGLLIGGLSPAEKANAQLKIKNGSIKLVVGTHALIAAKVDMHRLGLIIIDEQHRFGVQQRKKLQKKAGHMPHVLHMSATPIPRSLALTLFGELDISILNEMPAGRHKVETKLWSPNSRKQLNALIDEQISSGRQVFMVCPLITESEKLAALSVEAIYKKISTHDFKHRRIGLLHGKLKPSEKEEVMKQFLDHKYDILVSTTVIEVGVDIPNASVMVIEGAERFGLAQIHQLRGRVGRGQYKSYCYLLPSDSQEPGSRLRSLETITNGFELAELDLQLRGPGAIYGTAQHGALDLRVAELSDLKLITAARASAEAFIKRKENLLQYPQLAARVAQLRAVTNLN